MTIFRAKTFIRSKQIKATQTFDSTQLCKYVCVCVCFFFLSVMKHKYYSVLGGDLLFVFYGPSRLFHFAYATMITVSILDR